MDSMSSFKFGLRNSDIRFLYAPIPSVSVPHNCRICSIGGSTIPLQRLIFRVFAITRESFFGLVRSKDFLVVLLNDRFHVIDATVAYFYCISIEYLMVFMVSGEMFINQLQEYTAVVDMSGRLTLFVSHADPYR